jgi:proline iminopeptidase
MEYASRHPERLTHLILMNTAPSSHQDVQTFRQHLGRIRPAGDVQAMQQLAATDGFRAGELDIESEYYRIHYQPTLRSLEMLNRLLPRLRRNFTPERVLTARAIEDRLYDQTWSSPGYNLIPALRRLTAPTLVLHGEHDFVPAALAARVAEAIPTARFTVLPQCGHLAYMEAPDAVVEHLRALFAAAPTAAREGQTRASLLDAAAGPDPGSAEPARYAEVDRRTPVGPAP